MKKNKKTLDISNVKFNPTQPQPVLTIVEEFIRGEVNDAPAYQRPDASTLDWKRELVRSILMGFPINSLYLREVTHPIFGIEIVDGGHRVRVLSMFYQNKIKTPDNCFVKFHGKEYDVSNMTYKQIADIHGKRIRTRMFDNRTLSVNYVEGDDVSIANVFKLVNNGNDLSSQEVRQASCAEIANAIRSISHQTIDKNSGKIIPGWHRVFNVSDFKIGRWDYGHVTAQAAQYELNTDRPDLSSKALDSLYLNPDYEDKFPIIKRVNNIYNKMESILQHRDFTYKKGFFTNFYMFVSWLDSNKYKIDDPVKFMSKYEEDEFNRRTIKPIGAAKSPYNNATKEYTWKFVVERLNYILLDFANSSLEEYGIIQLDSKRTFTLAEKTVRFNKVGGKCECCNVNIPSPEMSEADHIIPYSQGGTTTIDNLQITCRSCNRSKGNSSKMEVELVA
jgi:hypothetical protein